MTCQYLHTVNTLNPRSRATCSQQVHECLQSSISAGHLSLGQMHCMESMYSMPLQNTNTLRCMTRFTYCTEFMTLNAQHVRGVCHPGTVWGAPSSSPDSLYTPVRASCRLPCGPLSNVLCDFIHATKSCRHTRQLNKRRWGNARGELRVLGVLRGRGRGGGERGCRHNGRMSTSHSRSSILTCHGTGLSVCTDSPGFLHIHMAG